MLCIPSLLVLDDIYPDPDVIRMDALASPLVAHPELHKGRRSPSRDIFEAHIALFEKLLGMKFVSGYTCFQVCVAGDQLVYHSDQQSHAAVVFLTPNAPPESGTSFYRSKLTGVRSAPTAAMAEKIGVTPEQLERDTYGGKLLDRTAWTEVDRIGNVYNRMAIWDARLIHGASDYFGSTAQDGRLFEMFFFDMK